MLKAFIGFFILLISTQAFAVCDAEKNIYLEARSVVNADQNFTDPPNFDVEVQLRIYLAHPESDFERYYQQEMGKLINEASGIKEKMGQNNKFTIHNRKNLLERELHICHLKESRALRANRNTSNSVSQNNSNQSQSQSQSSSQPQQQSQQSQQRAQEAQQRVEQDRKGKRRRHEPESEAHQCIAINNNDPGFGSFVNKCNFAVEYNFCNFNPKKDSWAEAHNCVGRSGNAGAIRANGVDGAHVKNTQTVYFFACKSPAWPVDTEYVAGQGIRGRCHTMGRD